MPAGPGDPLQCVLVFADGRPAGTWYGWIRNGFLRWCDQDFNIPAGLTSGKSRLDIRLEPLPAVEARPGPLGPALRFPDSALTDFAYTVFCFETAGAAADKDGEAGPAGDQREGSFRRFMSPFVETSACQSRRPAAWPRIFLRVSGLGSLSGIRPTPSLVFPSVSLIQ